MKTLTNPALLLEGNTYTIRSSTHVQNCSPYISYFGLLRDTTKEQAWETFGAPAVPLYFENGMGKFRALLEEFADLKKPYSGQIEKKLEFMLEALIQARQLIEEQQV